jgi:exonuclease I
MEFCAAVLDELNYIPPSYNIEKIVTDVTFNVLLAWHRENRNPAIFDLANEISDKLKLEPWDGK